MSNLASPTSIIDLAISANNLALNTHDRCIKHYSNINNYHTGMLWCDEQYECVHTINTTYHFAIEAHKITTAAVAITKSALTRVFSTHNFDDGLCKIVEAAFITAKAAHDIVHTLEVSVDTSLTILFKEQTDIDNKNSSNI